MENEPRNYEEPPPKPLLDRFYAWYIAKWWHPLIHLAILLSGWLLQSTIFSYYIEMNEESSMFIDFLFILIFFVILFAAFIHFLRAKRWRDFRLLFLASIILVCGYLFLTLVIDLAHYT